MANKSIFSNKVTNEAGGVAYQLTPKESLAQVVMTGTFNQTYYSSAKEQLLVIKDLLSKIDDIEFVAKLAIYARQQGFMKDTPAFLTAWLSIHGSQYLEEVFGEVIDNGKMLRNFVQIMRSGVVGRTSLGSKPKKLVQKWLNDASSRTLINSLVGSDPRLADIIKMVHPCPIDPMHSDFFEWVISKDQTSEKYLQESSNLLKEIKELILLRKGEKVDSLPKVPFELLTNLNLSQKDWKDIAINAGWQMTRMNLNTFGRKGLYDDSEVIEVIANRLNNKHLINKNRVMPYQLLTTWNNIADDVPNEIANAVSDALDKSLDNVPIIPGKLWVFLDISGSMRNSITGYRKGSSSKTSCAHVAALMGSALLKKNPDTKILMFDDELHESYKIYSNSSVLNNCDRIIKLSEGGGTSCELPLEFLVEKRFTGDTLIYVSDNQSWFNSYFPPESPRWLKNGQTRVKRAWTEFKEHNTKARMICIDIQPFTTTQISTDKDVLNVGGFGDEVFNVIKQFVETDSQFSWVDLIEDSIKI